VPFIVAVNRFDGAQTHSTEDVRDALTIGPHVPIVTCDARDRVSTKETLIALIDHAVSMRDRGIAISR
jgi:signal recognition particle receptor subunit beta